MYKSIVFVIICDEFLLIYHLKETYNVGVTKEKEWGSLKMNKQQVGAEIVVEDFSLSYFIIKSEIDYEGEVKSVYGIEIVKKSLLQIEKSKIEDLTSDIERAEEIANNIKKNMVTPVHLYDVMENFL